MNDEQIQDLFRSEKQEIADEGFSQRIMTSLPRRINILPQIIVAIFSLIGCVIVMAMIGMSRIADLWESFLSPSGIDLTEAMIGTYLYVIAAMLTIGLSIKKAAA